jgi:hypothetical protein
MRERGRKCLIKLSDEVECSIFDDCFSAHLESGDASQVY